MYFLIVITCTAIQCIFTTTMYIYMFSVCLHVYLHKHCASCQSNFLLILKIGETDYRRTIEQPFRSHKYGNQKNVRIQVGHLLPTDKVQIFTEMSKEETQEEIDLFISELDRADKQFSARILKRTWTNSPLRYLIFFYDYSGTVTTLSGYATSKIFPVVVDFYII